MKEVAAVLAPWAKHETDKTLVNSGVPVAVPSLLMMTVQFVTVQVMFFVTMVLLPELSTLPL